MVRRHPRETGGALRSLQRRISVPLVGAKVPNWSMMMSRLPSGAGRVTHAVLTWVSAQWLPNETVDSPWNVISM